MATHLSLTDGQPYPLGATPDVEGVNFAVVAPHAQRVELCVFDTEGQHELASFTLPTQVDGVWHGYLQGARTGLVYGYRVHGQADVPGGRYRPDLVMLDPYARELVGRYHGQDAAFLARVVDRLPVAPGPVLNKRRGATVIYEAHVKGFTMLHPEVPEPLRGTYAGLAHPVVLDYLESLGISALNLLPLQQRADEPRLLRMGLTNYWGYSPIGYFAPEPRYWSGRPGTTPASELREMVEALHARGIEVILDVVFNHTAELDDEGPMLSFRGIDNALYYHRDPQDPQRYLNYTGCGNTLNVNEPRVLQLVMDALRYWVSTFGIDGFRFDLAPVLGRSAKCFSPRAPFFAAVLQDPVLARVKLIAEPWDLGPGGYQLGHFPPSWMEWNDRFRDVMRAFWLRGDVTLGQFAMRLAGSSDLFEQKGRLPTASVNFICAHDGFTLRDLVSYDERHNEANGEDNRDGHAHNLSWNCGVEGPTPDANVLALRSRLQRALLATLVFAHGTPMLLAGDELGRTQQGNNNAYCQDNALNWLDWDRADFAMARFVTKLLALRHARQPLNRGAWREPIRWFRADGQALDAGEWNDPGRRSIGVHLGVDTPQACLLLINAHEQPEEFRLPPGGWQQMLDSADPDAHGATHETGAVVPARAVLLLFSLHGPQAPVHPY